MGFRLAKKIKLAQIDKPFEDVYFFHRRGLTGSYYIFIYRDAMKGINHDNFSRIDYFTVNGLGNFGSKDIVSFTPYETKDEKELELINQQISILTLAFTKHYFTRRNKN